MSRSPVRNPLLQALEAVGGRRQDLDLALQSPAMLAYLSQIMKGLVRGPYLVQADYRERTRKDLDRHFFSIAWLNKDNPMGWRKTRTRRSRPLNCEIIRFPQTFKTLTGIHRELTNCGRAPLDLEEFLSLVEQFPEAVPTRGQGQLICVGTIGKDKADEDCFIATESDGPEHKLRLTAREGEIFLGPYCHFPVRRIRSKRP